MTDDHRRIVYCVYCFGVGQYCTILCVYAHIHLTLCLCPFDASFSTMQYTHTTYRLARLSRASTTARRGNSFGNACANSSSRYRSVTKENASASAPSALQPLCSNLCAATYVQSVLVRNLYFKEYKCECYNEKSIINIILVRKQCYRAMSKSLQVRLG